ncbi:MAG: hypothetical protein PHU42_00150 [Patescibacteria group bacterium]|nr:hypothetical protein [Patescibacteria group bacterium]
MLNKKDIQNIVEATTKANKETFVTKDDLKIIKDGIGNIKESLNSFATKDDFKDLKLSLISAMEKVFPTEVKMDKRFDKVEESFSDLQTSVDAYAKQSNDYFQEMVVSNNSYHRLEGWIHQVAEKVGVELRY